MSSCRTDLKNVNLLICEGRSIPGGRKLVKTDNDDYDHNGDDFDDDHHHHDHNEVKLFRFLMESWFKLDGLEQLG